MVYGPAFTDAKPIFADEVFEVGDSAAVFGVGGEVVAESAGIMIWGDLFEEIGGARHVTIRAIESLQREFVGLRLLLARETQLGDVEPLGQHVADGAVRSEEEDR